MHRLLVFAAFAVLGASTFAADVAHAGGGPKHAMQKLSGRWLFTKSTKAGIVDAIEVNVHKGTLQMQEVLGELDEADQLPRQVRISCDEGKPALVCFEVGEGDDVDRWWMFFTDAHHAIALQDGASGFFDVVRLHNGPKATQGRFEVQRPYIAERGRTPQLWMSPADGVWTWGVRLKDNSGWQDADEARLYFAKGSDGWEVFAKSGDELRHHRLRLLGKQGFLLTDTRTGVVFVAHRGHLPHWAQQKGDSAANAAEQQACREGIGRAQRFLGKVYKKQKSGGSWSPSGKKAPAGFAMRTKKLGEHYEVILTGTQPPLDGERWELRKGDRPRRVLGVCDPN